MRATPNAKTSANNEGHAVGEVLWAVGVAAVEDLPKTSADGVSCRTEVEKAVFCALRPPLRDVRSRGRSRCPNHHTNQNSARLGPVAIPGSTHASPYRRRAANKPTPCRRPRSRSCTRSRGLFAASAQLQCPGKIGRPRATRLCPSGPLRTSMSSWNNCGRTNNPRHERWDKVIE